MYIHYCTKRREINQLKAPSTPIMIKRPRSGAFLFPLPLFLHFKMGEGWEGGLSPQISCTSIFGGISSPTLAPHSRRTSGRCAYAAPFVPRARRCETAVQVSTAEWDTVPAGYHAKRGCAGLLFTILDLCLLSDSD